MDFRFCPDKMFYDGSEIAVYCPQRQTVRLGTVLYPTANSPPSYGYLQAIKVLGNNALPCWREMLALV